MSKKTLVDNASDEKQVKDAGRQAKLQRDTELADIKAVLSKPEGRRMMWRILSECSVFGSVWHPSAAIHYNSGRQDLGHWLMSEINDADAESLYKLMRENYKRGELSV